MIALSYASRKLGYSLRISKNFTRNEKGYITLKSYIKGFVSKIIML